MFTWPKVLWQYLPSRAKIQKNWYLINFATLYNGEKYGKLLFWSYLLSWAKLRIKWYLAKFATLSKTVENDYFDDICHTEQRYRRSDNLTSFTTPGKTQIKWFFAQIYYPGKNFSKMSFGHITIHWAKISEIATLTEFAIESTAFKNSSSIAFAYLGKNLTNVCFTIKFDTLVNVLIK